MTNISLARSIMVHAMCAVENPAHHEAIATRVHSPLVDAFLDFLLRRYGSSQTVTVDILDGPVYPAFQLMYDSGPHVGSYAYADRYTGCHAADDLAYHQDICPRAFLKKKERPGLSKADGN